MLQLENFALKIAFWAISGPNMPVVAVQPHCQSSLTVHTPASVEDVCNHVCIVNLCTQCKLVSTSSPED